VLPAAGHHPASCQCPSIERRFDVRRGSSRDTDAGACSIASAADDEPGMDRDGQTRISVTNEKSEVEKR
jgi:hypothetical protein